MAEPYLEPNGTGIVVLDIGGDIGAAVVYVDETLAGKELEIRRLGEPWAGQHTGIRQRRVDGGTPWAAVFPSLPAGGYETRVMATTPPHATALVTVSGGFVTSVSCLLTAG
jgi:hypothetical protein